MLLKQTFIRRDDKILGGAAENFRRGVLLSQGKCDLPPKSCLEVIFQIRL